MNIITQDELRRILDYDSDSGIFIWKVRLSKRNRINDIAGNVADDGRVYIRIHKKLYLAHRLVWLYVYGFMPKRLDHIDQNPTNNRLSNLRECNRSQNGANRGLNKNNSSGYKGVYWNNKVKKWQAYICVYGKSQYLGIYDKIEDAANAYNNAAIENFGEFACLNNV